MEQKLADLTSWAKQNGADLHDHVEIVDDETYGISLVARALLTQDDQIVSCPFSLSLSYFNALDLFPALKSHRADGPHLPQEFLDATEPHVIGNFFLMLQYLKGEQSYWWNYIRCLPQPDEPAKLATPMFWDEADRAFLAGTQVGASLDARESKWKQDFKSGMSLIDKDSPPNMLHVKRKMTWEIYRWAAAIFASRSFISSLLPDKIFQDGTNPGTDDMFRQDSAGTRSAKTLVCGVIPVLFPLLDLANHNPMAKVTWLSDVQSSPPRLSLRTDITLEANSQVFNNYAPKGNSQLLLGYGFVLPDNHDISLVPRSLEGNALVLKRGWSDVKDLISGSEKASYTLRNKPFPYLESGRLDVFARFFDGCIDHLTLLVANDRERSYMKPYSDQRAEIFSKSWLEGPLGRAVLAVASALQEMLRVLLQRILAAGERLASPSTATQHTASQYRQGQIDLLESAIAPLEGLLQDRIRTTPISSQTSLLTLESAFTEPFHSSRRNQRLLVEMENAIRAELDIQPDEVLDWDELEEDWSFTLWCVWIYGQLLDVWRTEPVPPRSWVSHVHEWEQYGAGDSVMAEEGFCGEDSEWEALENICKKLDIARLGWSSLPQSEMVGLMLEAGRIAKNESIMVRTEDDTLKRLMCLYKTSDA